jgi:hypothetical protein
LDVHRCDRLVVPLLMWSDAEGKVWFRRMFAKEGVVEEVDCSLLQHNDLQMVFLEVEASLEIFYEVEEVVPVLCLTKLKHLLKLTCDVEVDIYRSRLLVSFLLLCSTLLILFCRLYR